MLLSTAIGLGLGAGSLATSIYGATRGGPGYPDPVRYTKKLRFGKDVKRALQPGMIGAWRRMMDSGGVPYMPELSDEINKAYAGAQADLSKAGYGADVTAGIRSDMGIRGDIAGDTLGGAVGRQGQTNMLNTAGQQAGYLGQLTARKKQYGVGSPTPSTGGTHWTQLMQPIANFGRQALAAIPGRPALTPAQMGLMGPGASWADPFAGARTF